MVLKRAAKCHRVAEISRTLDRKFYDRISGQLSSRKMAAFMTPRAILTPTFLMISQRDALISGNWKSAGFSWILILMEQKFTGVVSG